MKILSRISLAALVAGVLAVAGGCENGPKPKLPAGTGGVFGGPTIFTLGDMETLRVQSEHYVRKVRQLVPPKSAEGLECEKRYAFSQAAVNGAIVDLQHLVMAGRNPAQDNDFSSKAAAAREEITGFINYAEAELQKVVAPEARVTSRSAAGAVSERVVPFAFVGMDIIAGLGNWAWKQLAEARKVSAAKAEESAKRTAAGFDRQRWRDFDDIVSGKK